MNPSSQPYQPGELPPVPPAFPGDAAAASLTAEPPVLKLPFPTSLYILPGTSLAQFETARQERVHPHDLPQGW